MERYGETHRIIDVTGSTIKRTDGSALWDAPLVPVTSKGFVQFDLNSCIRRFTRLISGGLKGKTKLHTALGSEAIPVNGSPTQMMAVFTGLVTCAHQLAPHGSITIIVTLLPFDVGIDSERMGNGCALLSLHAARAKGERIGNLQDLQRGGLLRALLNVRTIVERHHGCLRLYMREAEIIFNIYLPVAEGVSSTPRKNKAESSSGEKERL
jgi:hypothetical protein